MPTLEPLLRLRPPARAASLDLSVASTVTFAPEIFRFCPAVPPPISTLDSPWLTTTLTAPAREILESAPATDPARDWAASLPRKSPSMFWVSLLVTVTSSVPVRSPFTFTPEVLLFTLTATPKAMEFAFFARLMAAPVPMVLKLPVFSAVAEMPFPALMPPISVWALWLAMVRPTAAATCTLVGSLSPPPRPTSPRA